jgi:hypothetical protein
VKYAKRRAGLDKRREQFDSLSADQKNGRKRPGSLNKGGPLGKRR